MEKFSKPLSHLSVPPDIREISARTIHLLNPGRGSGLKADGSEVDIYRNNQSMIAIVAVRPNVVLG
jgi:hypothetical protein